MTLQLVTQLRSVHDFDSDDDLRNAMTKVQLVDGTFQEGMVEKGSDLPKNSDWVLSNYDAPTTRVQTVQEEFERLRVLRSYMILDAEPEEVFQKFTAIAAHEFKVPIALVSLVDMGRQWFAGSCGLAAKETPRNVAFCSHAIQRIDKDILHVEDASKDDRFKDNPLVTGPPDIRFYAGAPLISPEGYALGTFCVIGREPRGLTENEKETLRALANKTVERMVTRRRKLEQRGLKPRMRRAGRRSAGTISA